MRPGARLTVERRGPRGPGASCLSARGALARITGVDVGDELRQLGGRRRVALPVTSNDGTARHHPPRGRERRAERGGRRARQHWASAIRIDQLQIRLPISSLTQQGENVGLIGRVAVAPIRKQTAKACPRLSACTILGQESNCVDEPQTHWLRSGSDAMLSVRRPLLRPS